jgi:uncharacterized protein
MKLHSRLWAISLIALGSATFLNAYAAHSQGSFTSQNSNSTILSNRTSFKPGLNRVTFKSEGETLVGNLYLPTNYQPGDRLPTVIVTGAWMTIKEQMPGLYAQKLADRGFSGK